MSVSRVTRARARQGLRAQPDTARDQGRAARASARVVRRVTASLACAQINLLLVIVGVYFGLLAAYGMDSLSLVFTDIPNEVTQLPASTSHTG